MRGLYLIFLALVAAVIAKQPANAILLSKVKSLTLNANRQTTARRVKALPQLKCVGGNAKGLYDVDVMRCKNTGSEYGAEDISWTCNANLPPEFKLGSTEVICEGYASADDPYVLKGSCGVEYRIALTELGESKYGTRQGWSSKLSSYDDEAPSTLYTTVFWLVFLGIIGFFIYKIFIENTGIARNVPRRYGGGYWGGGGGSDDDPPPPYSPRPPRSTQKTQQRQSQSQSSQGAWRPGFWTGAATGAAAGYAFGNRGSNTRTQNPQAGPSNWFNTGARNNNAGGSTFFGSNTGSRSGDTASPGPSSARYESTGFGGTRRR